MSFENPFEQTEFTKHPEALKRAEGLINEYQIKENTFSDLYGEENVKKDMEYVGELEKKFLEKDGQSTDRRVLKEKADILEAILFNEGEQSMWFGESAVTIMASKYDDYANGIDMFVEIPSGDGLSTAAFAIDVTFTSDTEKKVSKIIENTIKGKLSKAKYFDPDLSDIRGEMSNIPRVVIGVNGDSAAELINLFAEKKNDDLAVHPAQHQFTSLIVEQAELLAKVAHSSGQEIAAAKYEQLCRRFSVVREERAEIVPDNGVRDTFYKKLMTQYERTCIEHNVDFSRE